MCGRVVSSSSVTQLVDWLRVDEVVAPELPASWNVAPGRDLYVVAGTRAGTRRLGVMRWGLVPSWSTDPSSGPRPINARAESLLERPAFADLVAHRRCLVPVDGFYEWRRLPTGRQPWFLAPDGGGPLVLAGLWDRWVARSTATRLVTVTIVTVAANDDVGRLHDRMPAVLASDEARTRGSTRPSSTRPPCSPCCNPADAGYLGCARSTPGSTASPTTAPTCWTEAEEPASLF